MLNLTNPTINIIQPHNIILAQISATLDFNQHQLLVTDVGEAVLFTEGDVAVFTCLGFVLDFANLHNADSLHDDPVLGAFVVVLQAE